MSDTEANPEASAGESTGNGDGDYGAFLQEMKDKGLLRDGDEIAAQGMALLAATPGYQTSYKYLISVDTEGVFKARAEALLTDHLARTKFKDDAQRLFLLAYVSWCLENNVPLDNAIRWVVSAPSVGGESRLELVEVMTSFNYRRSTYGNNKRGVSTPDQRRKGAIS